MFIFLSWIIDWFMSCCIFTALSLLPRTVPGISAAATINSDFINDPITVTFEQGEEVKTVQVPILDDKQEEGLESFVVRIKEVKQDPNGGITVTDASIDNDNRETIVYIEDDDGECLGKQLGNQAVSSMVKKNVLRKKVPKLPNVALFKTSTSLHCVQ